MRSYYVYVLVAIKTIRQIYLCQEGTPFVRSILEKSLIKNSLQANQINNLSLPNLQCAVRWHQRYWRRVGEKCTQIKCVAVFRNELDRLFCRAEFAAANLMPRLRPPRAASLQQHTTRSDQST